MTLTVGDLGGATSVARVAPHDFREIILALVLNAEQALAGRPGGVITLRLERDHQGLVVAIDDNGPGLSAELGDPFAPFTTTKAAAAGLGLFAARALAERNGATLAVRIEARRRRLGGAAPRGPVQRVMTRRGLRLD